MIIMHQLHERHSCTTLRMKSPLITTSQSKTSVHFSHGRPRVIGSVYAPMLIPSSSQGVGWCPKFRYKDTKHTRCMRFDDVFFSFRSRCISIRASSTCDGQNRIVLEVAYQSLCLIWVPFAVKARCRGFQCQRSRTWHFPQLYGVVHSQWPSRFTCIRYEHGRRISITNSFPEIQRAKLSSSHLISLVRSPI